MNTTVSIHAPRAGRDIREIFHQLNEYEFQSTRPARGATTPQSAMKEKKKSFNPRAPRGARLDFLRHFAIRETFQSTRPARGATEVHADMRMPWTVSIHAPRAGRDLYIKVYYGK